MGDSGELVTAVAVLGIPHPSGYPLYVLLGKLWTLLVPIGSIAFRMSLFSAFWAAAACGMLYRLSRETRLSVPASILSALLLAFAPTFWAEANVQRVYALNAFFVAWATLLAVRWHQADEEHGRPGLRGGDDDAVAAQGVSQVVGQWPALDGAGGDHVGFCLGRGILCPPSSLFRMQ